MNPPSWLDPAFCLRLTLTLGHFLWQGAIIAMLVALANLLLRRASANKRYWLSVSAITLMASCPLVTFSLLAEPASLRPVAEISEAPAESVSPDNPVVADATTSVQADAHPVPISTPGPPAPSTPPETRPSLDWPRYAPYVTGLYLLGVLIFAVRFLVGLHGGQRLRRRSQPVDEPAILAALARQAKALRLTFAPAIAYCRNVLCPTVVGVIRPTILLPVSILSGLTVEQVEVLLAHELAHIRRYDHLVNVLQRLIEAFLFFHPGVWYVSRRIRIEREHCCDDLVVAAGSRPIDYAASLVRLAELARESPGLRPLEAAALGAAGRPSQLRVRVVRLLGGAGHPRVRLGRTWGVGLAAFAALSIAACFYHHTQAASNERSSQASKPAEDARAEREPRSTPTSRWALPELIYIPGGTFTMGPPYSSPLGGSKPAQPAEVRLDSFCIGKYEVTAEQFCQFLNDSRVEVFKESESRTYVIMKGEPNIPLVRLWERCTIEKFGDGFRPVPGCRVRPANCVSWYGAVAYCRWLSGVTGEMHRLPTEAEWEYAARGPEGRLFPWGGTELQTSYANVPGHWMVTVQRTLRKVGDSPKDCTPNGIYDLVGNVREWCSDWYGNPPIYGGTNPQGLSFGYWKTLRGHGYQNSDGWKALHLTDLPGLRGTCLHVALLWVTSGQGLSRDDLGTGVATC